MADTANKSAVANVATVQTATPTPATQTAPIPKEVDTSAIYADVVNKLQANAQQAQVVASPVSKHWSKVKKTKFEIEIYDEVTNDETGEIVDWKKVNTDKPVIIEAFDRAELNEIGAQYRLCHQRIKVLHMLDENGNPIKIDKSGKAVSSQAAPTQVVAPNATTQTTAQQQEQAAAIPAAPSKPLYYKLGDIEVKCENGKMYQKQWIRLSDSEASNFRIINSKTNAKVALTGKHIEMKKWVLVENTSEDASTSLEDQLNG